MIQPARIDDILLVAQGLVATAIRSSTIYAKFLLLVVELLHAAGDLRHQLGMLLHAC
jgi:hypothetical protein